MKIRRLWMGQFGKFNKIAFDFKPGMNIIYGSNGSGKSTLVGAISLLLNGFARGNKKYFYYPLDGDAIEVSCDIIDDSITRIRRLLQDGALSSAFIEGEEVRIGNGAIKMASVDQLALEATLWRIEHMAATQIEIFQRDRAWQKMISKALMPSDILKPREVIANLDVEIKTLYTNHSYSKSSIAQIDNDIKRLYDLKRHALLQKEQGTQSLKRYEYLLEKEALLKEKLNILQEEKTYIIEKLPIFELGQKCSVMEQKISNQNLFQKINDTSIVDLTLLNEKMIKNAQLIEQLKFKKETLSKRMDIFKTDYPFYCFFEVYDALKTSQIISVLKKYISLNFNYKKVCNKLLDTLSDEQIMSFDYKRTLATYWTFLDYLKQNDAIKSKKRHLILRKILFIALLFSPLSAVLCAHFLKLDSGVFVAVLLFVIVCILGAAISYRHFERAEKKRIFTLEMQLKSASKDLMPFIDVAFNHDAQRHNLELIEQAKQLLDKMTNCDIVLQNNHFDKTQFLSFVKFEETNFETFLDKFYLDYWQYLNGVQELERLRVEENIADDAHIKIQNELRMINTKLYALFGTLDLAELAKQKEQANHFLNEYKAIKKIFTNKAPDIEGVLFKEVTSLEDINASIVKLQAQLITYKEELAVLAHTLESANNQLEEINIDIEQNLLKRQHYVAKYDEQIFLKAIIEAVEKAISIDLKPEFINLANLYIKEIAKGDLEHLALDESGYIKLREKGLNSEITMPRLSVGGMNQLYFTLQLALLETYDPNNILPLVIDDALMSYDQTRFLGCLSLIKKVVKHRQVIYCTSNVYQYNLLKAEFSECHIITQQDERFIVS